MLLSYLPNHNQRADCDSPIICNIVFLNLLLFKTALHYALVDPIVVNCTGQEMGIWENGGGGGGGGGGEAREGCNRKSAKRWEPQKWRGNHWGVRPPTKFVLRKMVGDFC